MSTTTPDYLTTLRDSFTGAMQQWVDQSTTAWDQWSQAWSPMVAAVGFRVPAAPGTPTGHRHQGGHHHDSHRHGHHDGCGCRDTCECCVPEADVVVHARAGEVRVVPFRLHNPWRREREVTLEVGPWHGCAGDDLQIRAVLEDDKVVLGPCEDRVVRLLVSTRGSAGDGSNTTGTTSTTNTTDTTNTKDTKVTKDGTTAAVPGDVMVGRFGGATDVRSCESAYADVRFEGCARPQRVAVVVLPTDCDAVEVGCDCGCCC
ncbi:hypothetical protein BJ986_001147 [Phycicoccus badiiscoriae]|uniref:Uncharacterized protein n=1 Tax=Pedococcus badiiscoriae TaxID=642776 RepID=A0A852WD85_9MICO|nr:hypothetical protein [Pedococcus badiiscoriae]NYG06660.1 hypothetical protein [Pedococcus badiiscoriae]